MLAEDLDVYFDTDGFATAALLAGAAVMGILSDGTAESFDTLVPGPSFTLRSSSAPAAAAGQQLVVGAAAYEVRRVERLLPDSALTRLTLVTL